MTDAEGLRTSVWRDRDVLPLWRSQTVSETGSHITVLALPLVAVVLLDSSVVEQQVLRLRREHRIGTGAAGRPLRHRRFHRPPRPRPFLRRATAWFAARGVTVERVLTDNAWAYSKNTWCDTCHDLGISPRWTRPWRPRTSSKVERFHRALLDEWAYQQPYIPDAERQAAFPDWLDWYNYHRPHTGISGHTPASRVTNLSEQHA